MNTESFFEHLSNKMGIMFHATENSGVLVNFSDLIMK
jgi:hypothetical protein